MSVDQNVELGLLVDIYGDFLSHRQREILIDYVNNDLSLGEIADKHKITRSAVMDAVSKARQKLYDFENRIRYLKLRQALSQLKDCDPNHLRQQIMKLLEEY